MSQSATLFWYRVYNKRLDCRRPCFWPMSSLKEAKFAVQSNKLVWRHTITVLEAHYCVIAITTRVCCLIFWGILTIGEPLHYVWSWIHKHVGASLQRISKPCLGKEKVISGCIFCQHIVLNKHFGKFTVTDACQDCQHIHDHNTPNNIQVTIFVTCLNFATTGLQILLHSVREWLIAKIVQLIWTGMLAN